MQLRYKVMLLAVVPLVLAAGLLAFVAQREGRTLVDDQVASVQRILGQPDDEAKRTEKQLQLKDFMDRGRETIRDLVDSGRDDKATKAQALERLRNLSFGQDIYFYVYSLDGTCLMHPRRPELEGHDQSTLRDDTGQLVIQPLIDQARHGGGFVHYRWPQPSQQKKWSPKLGYVVQVPRWNWMIGTGVYFEDVGATLEQIRASSDAATYHTLLSIAVIAMLAVLVVTALGVALNVSQQRLANAKLQALTRQVVDAQEAERVRISQYLHDEAMQDLIAVKCILDTALIELKSQSSNEKVAEILDQGLTGLVKGTDEIRRISRSLRPPPQGDGLPALLAQLSARFSERTGVTAVVEAPALPQPPSAEAATALVRVTQQALDNVDRHAEANRVAIQLTTSSYRGSPGTRLIVSDNGHGFDVAAVDARPDRGIGLLNMRERVEALGGRLSIRSGLKGTEVEAFLPHKAHQGGSPS